MSRHKYTNPSTAKETILAQGHSLAPGEDITLTLDQTHPTTIRKVDLGVLTADPVIPDFVLEAARGVLDEDPRFSGPVTSFQKAAIGPTSPMLRGAAHEAERASQVVVEGDDGPKAFATGVKVTFVMRDGNGDDILSNSGFGFRVVAIPVASDPSADIVVTPAAENVEPDRASGDAASPFVRLRSGKVVVTITGSEVGTVGVSMQQGTRAGITITDETVIELN